MTEEKVQADICPSLTLLSEISVPLFQLTTASEPFGNILFQYPVLSICMERILKLIHTEKTLKKFHVTLMKEYSKLHTETFFLQEQCSFPSTSLERRIGIHKQLLKIGLQSVSEGTFIMIIKMTEHRLTPTSNHVPASGAGCKASLYPQCASYRDEVVSEVPSHSPPGLTQTNASSSTSPVSVVGRTPKPVPMTLHQSPQAFCLVGCTPFRASWRSDI